MCLESLREKVERTDDHVLKCTHCDRRAGSPSSGYTEGDQCPFCEEGIFVVDTQMTVEDVYESNPKKSLLE